MMWLLIKGSPEEAKAEAEKRGLKIEIEMARLKDNQTTARLLDGEGDEVKKVMDWYIAGHDHQAPFPVGTLLFYSSNAGLQTNG